MDSSVEIISVVEEPIEEYLICSEHNFTSTIKNAHCFHCSRKSRETVYALQKVGAYTVSLDTDSALAILEREGYEVSLHRLNLNDGNKWMAFIDDRTGGLNRKRGSGRGQTTREALAAAKSDSMRVRDYSIPPRLTETSVLPKSRKVSVNDLM